MKKILFIPYTFSMGGGAEKILADTVRNLDPEKYQVTILPYADYHVKQEIVPENVKVLPGILDLKKAGKAEKAIKHLLVHFCPCVLRKWYIKGHYDVQVSFNYQIPSFLVKETRQTKAIMWNHGDLYDLRDSKAKYWLQSRSFRRATKIVAISENTEKSIVELFPKFRDKVEIIYNGIHIDNIRQRAQEPCNTSLEPNAVVFLGRLEHNKQPMALLETARILKKRNAPIKMYLLGQGEQEKELKARIAEYGLENQVSLLGYQQNPYPLIAQAKVVCMMSLSEGFPTVFAEGMALGKPFISTDVGGVREMSENGRCGILVNSPEDCAEAIAQLIADEARYDEMSKACLTHIEEFSMARQKEHIEVLLNSL